MFCIECGTEIYDTAKFCHACGAAQIISVDSKSPRDLEKTQVYKFFNLSLEEFIQLEDNEIKHILLEAVEFFRINDPEIANYIQNNILIKFKADITGELYPDPIDTLFEKLLELERKSRQNNFQRENKFKEFNENNHNFNNSSMKILHSIRERKIKKDFFSVKIFNFIFFFWILNTILANLIGTPDGRNFSWEGWYLPGLSEITPMLIKEYDVFGEGDIRLASQAEVWRINRRARKIREGYKNFTGSELDKDLNNLQKMFKNWKN